MFYFFNSFLISPKKPTDYKTFLNIIHIFLYLEKTDEVANKNKPTKY